MWPKKTRKNLLLFLAEGAARGFALGVWTRLYQSLLQVKPTKARKTDFKSALLSSKDGNQVQMQPSLGLSWTNFKSKKGSHWNFAIPTGLAPGTVKSEDGEKGFLGRKFRQLVTVDQSVKHGWNKAKMPDISICQNKKKKTKIIKMIQMNKVLSFLFFWKNANVFLPNPPPPVKHE